MRQRRDALHLDRIHIFKWMIQNSWGIDYLPTKVLVVEVSNEKTFGSKGVRLDIDVRAGDLVDEGRFADVRVPADQERPRVWVDGRQPGDVLPDLLKVSKGIFLSTHDGSHSAHATLVFI
jgi:hypothetical protein